MRVVRGYERRGGAAGSIGVRAGGRFFQSCPEKRRYPASNLSIKNFVAPRSQRHFVSLNGNPDWEVGAAGGTLRGVVDRVTVERKGKGGIARVAWKKREGRLYGERVERVAWAYRAGRQTLSMQIKVLPFEWE